MLYNTSASRFNEENKILFSMPLSKNLQKLFVNLRENSYFAKMFDWDENFYGEMPEIKVEDPRKIPENKKECLICLCEFAQGESIKILPCFDFYHTKCIDKWAKNSCLCPKCKTNFVKKKKSFIQF